MSKNQAKRRRRKRMKGRNKMSRQVVLTRMNKRELILTLMKWYDSRVHLPKHSNRLFSNLLYILRCLKHMPVFQMKRAVEDEPHAIDFKVMYIQLSTQFALTRLFVHRNKERAQLRCWENYTQYLQSGKQQERREGRRGEREIRELHHHHMPAQKWFATKPAV